MDPATTAIYTYRHTLSLHDARPILFAIGHQMLLVVARAERAVGMHRHHRVARADDVARLVEFELERAEQHHVAGVHQPYDPRARFGRRAIIIGRRIAALEIVGHRGLGP